MVGKVGGLRDQGEHVCIKLFAADKQSIPQQSFSKGTHLFSDTLASRVAGRNDDLDPDQSKLRKAELRQQGGCLSREPLFSPRSSDPITN